MKTILVLTCLIAVSTAYSVQEDMLERHNKDRRRHGAKDLVTNQDLVDIAQICADRNAARDKIDHDCAESEDYGENLAWSMDSEGSPPPDEKTAVEDGYTGWYKENKNYDYNTGKSKGGVIGHFTQIVWKGTTQLGCAYAKNEDAASAVVGCVYNPPGNYGGKYKTNVGKPSRKSGK